MTLHEVMKKGLDGRGLIRESPQAADVDLHAVPFGRDRRATGCVDRTLNRTGSPTVDMRGSPAP